MAEKGSKNRKQAGSTKESVSAVDATNHYNRHIADFSVELGMEVLDTREVIAGVSIQLPHGEMAFIPADFLRALADEAEERARRAIAQANGG